MPDSEKHLSWKGHLRPFFLLPRCADPLPFLVRWACTVIGAATCFCFDIVMSPLPEEIGDESFREAWEAAAIPVAASVFLGIFPALARTAVTHLTLFLAGLLLAGLIVAIANDGLYGLLYVLPRK